MQKAWRYFIDGLVIVIAVLIFASEAGVSTFAPEQQVLPDRTVLIDEEVSSVLTLMEGDFSRYLQEPFLKPRLELRRLGERIPMSPSFNFSQNASSIVYITNERAGEQFFGSGSVLTADGVILTNYHNVEGAEKVVVTTYDGRHFPVVGLLAYDEQKDIAFLKIDTFDLRPIPVGDDMELPIAGATLVIGHSEGFLNTVSTGILSGRRNYTSSGEGAMLQFTNAMSSGNSGGALLNEFGELIGVPTATVEYTDNIAQVQNINLAVPITEALKILDNVAF